MRDRLRRAARAVTGERSAGPDGDAQAADERERDERAPEERVPAEHALAERALAERALAERALAERRRMVDVQLRARGIRDETVLTAILTVPREAFVGAGQRRSAYADDALPIEAGQTISQPYIVGRMTELLQVGPGDRVLDVGTGSGYQAAVLAAIGCSVVSIERHRSLADTARERLERLGYGDRVEVRVGDGSLGDPDGAPWRGIVVAAAAPRIPEALRGQLAADGGRLVLPVGSRYEQDLVVVTRDGDRWTETSDGPVVFVPLIGEGGFPG